MIAIDVAISGETMDLINLAKQMRDKAYCPYSHFRVGCALRTKSGKVYTGCNVENASYGGAICAERTALVNAVSDGETEFECIVVATDMIEPCTPCGICRQFIREFGKSIRIICAGSEDKILEKTLDELLPHSFGPEHLGK